MSPILQDVAGWF